MDLDGVAAASVVDLAVVCLAVAALHGTVDRLTLLRSAVGHRPCRSRSERSALVVVAEEHLAFSTTVALAIADRSLVSTAFTRRTVYGTELSCIGIHRNRAPTARP